MAEKKKAKVNPAENGTPAAASVSMQDLLQKLQKEGGAVGTEAHGSTPAQKYDADRAADTRRQLMEDYKRELEELGKEAKRRPPESV